MIGNSKIMDIESSITATAVPDPLKKPAPESDIVFGNIILPPVNVAVTEKPVGKEPEQALQRQITEQNKPSAVIAAPPQDTANTSPSKVTVNNSTDIADGKIKAGNPGGPVATGDGKQKSIPRLDSDLIKSGPGTSIKPPVPGKAVADLNNLFDIALKTNDLVMPVVRRQVGKPVAENQGSVETVLKNISNNQNILSLRNTDLQLVSERGPEIKESVGRNYQSPETIPAQAKTDDAKKGNRNNTPDMRQGKAVPTQQAQVNRGIYPKKIISGSVMESTPETIRMKSEQPAKYQDSPAMKDSNQNLKTGGDGEKTVLKPNQDEMIVPRKQEAPAFAKIASLRPEPLRQTMPLVKGMKPSMLAMIQKISQIIYRSAFSSRIQTSVVIDGGRLGALDVRFVRENEGNRVTILVNSERVRDVIQKFVPIVTEKLSQKGIDLSTVDVQVNNNQPRESGNRKQVKPSIKTSTLPQQRGVNEAIDPVLDTVRDFGYNTIEVLA